LKKTVLKNVTVRWHYFYQRYR